ncbi:hypothetical protein GLAREA_09608 [Glarea lozoyensis ATCC 20868]|nr:uncharacterized protein GLAREA_09608 [Glarea lozoyensis ATCC 20868]EPE28487.1 hypothetical protein GLAREA_09608 [Glarea lozoyensis ATCC 20868]
MFMRNQYWERWVKKVGVEELRSNERSFVTLDGELEGLRDWWRIEWEMWSRKKFDELDQSDDEDWWEQRNHWIGKSKKRMQLVISRLQKLKKDATPLTTDLSKATTPHEFNYSDASISQPPGWYRNNSPVWWLWHATTDLENRDDEYQEMIQMRYSEIEECDKLIGKLEREYEKVKSNPQVIENLKETFTWDNEGHEWRLQQFPTLKAQPKTSQTDLSSRIEYLNLKKSLLEATISATQHEYARSHAILQIVSQLTDNYDDLSRHLSPAQVLKPERVRVMQALHTICVVQERRYEVWCRLRDGLEEMGCEKGLSVLGKLREFNKYFRSYHDFIMEIAEEESVGVDVGSLAQGLVEESEGFEEVFGVYGDSHGDMGR